MFRLLKLFLVLQVTLKYPLHQLHVIVVNKINVSVKSGTYFIETQWPEPTELSEFFIPLEEKRLLSFRSELYLIELALLWHNYEGMNDYRSIFSECGNSLRNVEMSNWIAHQFHAFVGVRKGRYLWKKLWRVHAIQISIYVSVFNCL